MTRDASADDIKQSYRRLAKQLHPARNADDPHANEKFQDLAAAYETLSDANSRSIFDQQGEEGVQRNNAHGGSGGGGNPFGGPFGNPFGGFGGFGGGGGGKEFDDTWKTPKGANIVMDLYVTLEEIYGGKRIGLDLAQAKTVPALGTRQCRCRMRRVLMFAFVFVIERFMELCDECGNVEWIVDERTLRRPGAGHHRRLRA